MGCTLATGSGKDELREIRQVAIDYQAVEPNVPRLGDVFVPLMWIGWASEPTTDTFYFDVGGPYGWIDGCTPYTDNVVFDQGTPDQSTCDSVSATDANESSDSDQGIVWQIFSLTTFLYQNQVISLFFVVDDIVQLPAI